MASRSALLISAMLMARSQHNDAEDPATKSKQMMSILGEEFDCWQSEKFASEKNACNAIKRLMQINSSHPIQDGLFFIYFVKKTEAYHSCIGFKDLYIGKEFLIDMAYYHKEFGPYDPMITRMIPKEDYLPLSLCVSTLVVPLKNLEYFINFFYSTFGVKARVNLKSFLDSADNPYQMHSHLMTIIGSTLENSSGFECVESMMNKSIIFKFEHFADFSLPTAQNDS